MMLSILSSYRSFSFSLSVRHFLFFFFHSFLQPTQEDKVIIYLHYWRCKTTQKNRRFCDVLYLRYQYIPNIGMYLLHKRKEINRCALRTFIILKHFHRILRHEIQYLFLVLMSRVRVGMVGKGGLPHLQNQ